MAGNGSGNTGGRGRREQERGGKKGTNQATGNGRCGLTSLWIAAAALLLTSVPCPAACRAWTGSSGAARRVTVLGLGIETGDAGRVGNFSIRLGSNDRGEPAVSYK